VSIHWRCDCGKSLKAPDGSSGRKARCPACGQVNVVPAARVEENEGLEVLDDGPPPIPELPPPPPVRSPPVKRAVIAPPPPPVSEQDRVSDDDDWGEYDLKEEPVAPAPPPVRRPAAVAGSVAAGSGMRGGVGGGFTPPAYRPPAVSTVADEEDKELPLSERVREGRSWRDFTYLLLLLAMLPLVLSTFKKDNGTIIDILRQNMQAHPEVKEKLESEASDDMSPYDLASLFPGHRLDGALLERDTAMHWVFALVSAALFCTLMMFLFDGIHDAKPLALLLCGFFTGTVGIVLLLVFQFIANIALGIGLRGFHGGKLIIIILIIKFIGFSYYAADNPDYGFVLSFFGYTFGVGLCEEICKMLPLLWLMRTHPEKASWRGLCKWGLASGIGFGVAEGIMYSGRYYNGVLGADIYLVRFASCVALHAVWSASFAIAMYLNADRMTASPTVKGSLGYALLFAAPPMVLHGLYDTLLKKEHTLMALVVALVSFCYLAGLIEWSMLKADRRRAAAAARGFEVVPKRYAV
jgi:RsiW-degrading membrane proteinase PrsW (M82 family)